jgi:hypothetical protein
VLEQEHVYVSVLCTTVADADRPNWIPNSKLFQIRMQILYIITKDKNLSALNNNMMLNMSMRKLLQTWVAMYTGNKHVHQAENLNQQQNLSSKTKEENLQGAELRPT